MKHTLIICLFISSGLLLSACSIEPQATSLDFTAEFVTMHPCNEWPVYAEFRLHNTGSIALESMQLRIMDMESGEALYGGGSNPTPFVSQGGCPPGKTRMEPGKTAYTSASLGLPEVSERVKAEITLCTEDTYQEPCVTKEVIFAVRAEALADLGIPIVLPGQEKPGFKAEFTSIYSCGSNPDTVGFRVENTGNMPFRSATVSVVDVQTDIPLYGGSSGQPTAFVMQGTCVPSQSFLIPGRTTFLATTLQNLKTNTYARGVIGLCTGNKRDGICVEQIVEFFATP